ncbi:MAG: Ig-like domain-containing protein, partial [Planctomycetes bacterium]|nr:Ig-like domain-containing protein [Planctomycetota bacterium]
SGPADLSPASDVLLFGIDGPIPLQNIVYEGTSIQVSGPPDALNDAYATFEDTTLEIAAESGVLSNDTDGEGDLLRALLVTEPQHGEVTLELNGSFQYAPDPNFFGTDHFTYKANDGFFDSTPATVIISVTGTDDPPVAMDDRYSVFIDSSLDVLKNDLELDGQSLGAILQQPPQHGSLILNPNGSFTYTPASGFGGADQFTYIASDGALQSEAATVHLDVLFQWQNPTHSRDVSGDGWLSPRDALMVFNDLLQHGGSRILPDPPVPPETAPPFLDVTGDGIVSEFDGGLVLDDLNLGGSRQLSEPRLDLPQPTPDVSADPAVRFRLETTDESGAAMSQFALGETFYLNVYASDLRFLGAGIFSAYVDVTYDAAGLATAGDFEFGSMFPLVHTGDRLTAGVLNEVGGVYGSTPGDTDEQLLFRVPFTAASAGAFTFQADAADNLPASEVTLFGVDGALPADKIRFDTATVTVVSVDSDGDGVQDLEEDAAPNQGDANNDGIPDRQQAHIASLRSVVSQQFVTIAAPADLQLRHVRAIETPAGVTPPSLVTFPHGFFEFEVLGLQPGGSATLTWKLEAGAEANTYYRFGATLANPTPHLAAHLSDGVSGALIRTDRIDLQAVDGVRGDDDLAANGVFVERGAPGLSTRPWQNPVLAPDVTNDSGVSALDALTLINDINANGTRLLPMMPEGDQTIPPFLDVNGDGMVSPADVLDVVNYVNDQSLLLPGGEGESVAFGGLVAPAISGLEGGSTGSVADPVRQRKGVEASCTEASEPIRPVVDRVFAQYGSSQSPSRQRLQIHREAIQKATADKVFGDELNRL